MEPDELAAVIAALQAARQQPEEPQQQPSAWKRAARLEGIGVQ